MTIDDLGKNYKVVGSGGAAAVDAMATQTAAPKTGLQKVEGGLNAVFGGNQIGKSLVQAGTNVKNLATGGRAKYEQGLNDGNRVDVPALAGDYLKAGANFIPGAGEGASFAAKTAIGAGTGYAMDVGNKLANNKDSAFTPGAGTAIGGTLPVAGAVIKPASAIVGRLLKGLGSGLSGVSTETIDRIVENPDIAKRAAQKLAKSGNNKVVEDNARMILNGVSKIKKEASSAYSKGLESLSTVDINPDTLKGGLLGTLEKHGVSVSPEGKMDFSGAEFLDPKVQQRAEKVINHINQFPDLSGKGVRKLMDTIDTARFKSAPDGDRQAFNALMGDLKGSLKDGVDQSTSKLGEINKKYSNDAQLTEAVQNIFGKVNYRNLPEVVKASKKLESLFQQKGLEPQVVDDFLKRIGVHPEELKTSEAVRQISNKEQGANSVGLSMGEVIRGATSAIVTPEMVRNVSIATGLAENRIAPLLRDMKTPARNVLIQALLQAQQGTQQ